MKPDANVTLYVAREGLVTGADSKNPPFTVGGSCPAKRLTLLAEWLYAVVRSNPTCRLGSVPNTPNPMYKALAEGTWLPRPMTEALMDRKQEEEFGGVFTGVTVTSRTK